MPTEGCISPAAFSKSSSANAAHISLTLPSASPKPALQLVRKKKKVGNNIRKLRERARLTQEQVAAKLQIGGCDITRSAVAKIEVGQRHLYPDEIILLKDILSASYEEIFEV